MSKIALSAGLALALLAGCTQNINPTEADRAILGAAGLATVAKVAGKDDRTIIKSAAAGAAAGALCDDVRLCQ